MTSRSTWKKFERRVAKLFGGERNPLSGSASKHTKGDVIHDDYYIEAKLRKDLSDFFKKDFKETVNETIENSQDEDKDFFVVFKQKYSNRNFVLTDLETLKKLKSEGDE